MSMIFGTPITVRNQSQARDGRLVAAVKTWWVAYLTRRMERPAIIQLHAMSDRELKDIGLTRSQTKQAVTNELNHRPIIRLTPVG